MLHLIKGFKEDMEFEEDESNSVEKALVENWRYSWRWLMGTEGILGDNFDKVQSMDIFFKDLLVTFLALFFLFFSRFSFVDPPLLKDKPPKLRGY